MFGASGGIGAALVDELLRRPDITAVFAVSRTAARHPDPRVVTIAFDLTDEASIMAAAERIGSGCDLCLVATGVLAPPGSAGPEKALRALDPAALADIFALNTIGPALIAKHMLPLLPRDRRAVLAVLSARVGSITDNRLGGWHGYRASKAALNMLVRTIAVEAARSHPLAVITALHPGTVDTGLSRPFQRGVDPERLFTPARSAAALLDALDGLTPRDSGGFFAWDGQAIPF